MHLCTSSSNVPRLPSFLKLLRNPHRLLAFGQNPLRLPQQVTLERPKVVRICGVFTILTSKCASHHNRMQVFNIVTSAAEPEAFCTCWLRNMLCTTTAHTLFEHLNFQKCSEREATTACTFETCNLLHLSMLSDVWLLNLLPWLYFRLVHWNCFPRYDHRHAKMPPVLLWNHSNWSRHPAVASPTSWG